MLRSVGANKYAVVFDNGMERECASNSMNIVPKTAGLPPNDLNQVRVIQGYQVRVMVVQYTKLHKSTYRTGKTRSTLKNIYSPVRKTILQYTIV